MVEKRWDWLVLNLGVFLEFIYLVLLLLSNYMQHIAEIRIKKYLNLLELF